MPDTTVRGTLSIRLPKWAKDYTDQLVKEMADTTTQQIVDAVTAAAAGETDPDELAENIYDLMSDDLRADKIARTETMRAVNAGQSEAWEAALDEGYLDEGAMKVWIVTPDDRLCPECEAMDGETVPVDEEFDGGDPPRHPNCRCVLSLLT